MEPSELERFEAVVLPHLNAAYGLARYLTRDDADAEDVVQESLLRALKYFGGFRGDGAREGRAWLLAIVRNMAHTWRSRHWAAEATTLEFDETLHSEAVGDEHPGVELDRGEARATRRKRFRACRPTCGR